MDLVIFQLFFVKTTKVLNFLNMKYPSPFPQKILSWGTFMLGKCLRKKETRESVRKKELVPTSLPTSGDDLTWVHLPFSKFTKTVFPCRLILIIYPFRSMVSITNQSDPKTRVVYKILAIMKALNREHISSKLQKNVTGSIVRNLILYVNTINNWNQTFNRMYQWSGPTKKRKA